MTIRPATKQDIPKIIDLLTQILEVHAALRPDIFEPGGIKYSAEQLEQLLDDGTATVCVAENDQGEVVGHIVYSIKSQPAHNRPFNTLFIEDFCVDENARRQHVGQALFEHAKAEAQRLHCHALCLAVWEGNEPAQEFYRKMGMKPKLTQMELILD